MLRLSILDLFARRDLASEKKGLGVFALATELERAKIFKPATFRDVWFRL